MPSSKVPYVPPSSEDYRAPLAARDPRTRARPEVVFEPDEIEQLCVACTAVWGSAGWQHENSCPFRRSRPLA